MFSEFRLLRYNMTYSSSRSAHVNLTLPFVATGYTVLVGCVIREFVGNVDAVRRTLEQQFAPRRAGQYPESRPSQKAALSNAELLRGKVTTSVQLRDPAAFQRAA